MMCGFADVRMCGLEKMVERDVPICRCADLPMENGEAIIEGNMVDKMDVIIFRWIRL